MANVAFIRQEVSRLLPLYKLIRDCISGEHTVKSYGEYYLPMPDEDDRSPANKKRYCNYLKRAVFYNVTRRTLLGLLGQVFVRDPLINVPTLLQPLVDNANGGGVNLKQLSKTALSFVLSYSRCGIFVDYPATPDGATQAQIASGAIRPVISVWSPEEIINWRVVADGADEVLSLVVLFELFPFHDDGFEIKQGGQYRVLYLDQVTGNYMQQVWRQSNPSEYVSQEKQVNKKYVPFDAIEMKGSDGLPMKKIPFMFVGSNNNDANPDHPSFYDLASLNIAHYRNSADYEEHVYLLGQPTLVMTGLTEDWLKTQLKGTVRFGSRGGIPLPIDANAFLLEAKENGSLKEAMENKERQMVALGAKIVELKQVQRTAFETKIEASAEGSILSTCTQNVSDAFVWALQHAADFVNLPHDGIEFKLNTDFEVAQMTAQEQQQIVLNWQEGAITWDEMRAAFRRGGLATENDAEAKAKIAADEAIENAIEVEQAIKLGMANQNAAAMKPDNNSVVE